MLVSLFNKVTGLIGQRLQQRCLPANITPCETFKNTYFEKIFVNFKKHLKEHRKRDTEAAEECAAYFTRKGS